jgi:hypothetical protein
VTIELYDTLGNGLGAWGQSIPPAIGDYLEASGQRYRVVSRIWMYGGYTLRIICEEVK